MFFIFSGLNTVRSSVCSKATATVFGAGARGAGQFAHGANATGKGRAAPKTARAGPALSLSPHQATGTFSPAWWGPRASLPRAAVPEATAGNAAQLPGVPAEAPAPGSADKGRGDGGLPPALSSPDGFALLSDQSRLHIYEFPLLE